jgi:hypothetical protein
VDQKYQNQKIDTPAGDYVMSPWIGRTFAAQLRAAVRGSVASS